MFRIFLSTIVILSLASCAAGGDKPFHRMSFQELADYNAAVAAEDYVYCFEEVRAGSHIRKRFCSTVEDMIYGLDNSVRYLDTINYGAVTSF